MRIAHQLVFQVPAAARRTASASRWPLVLLVLLSSVLLPLALPSEFFGAVIRLFGLTPPESFFWGNAVLGLIAIAPVFYAVAKAPTFGFASILGLIFGGISTALSNYWLMFFQGYSVWTMGGTVLGYMGLNSLLFPFLRGFSRVGPRHRPFLFALAWCGYEYLKSVGFLGYPWGLIAYPMGDFLPLIQFVDITGIWGLSFLMALVNALVAEAALAEQRPHSLRLHYFRQVAFCLVLITLALIYGVARMSIPIPAETKASLLLVQQNSDPWKDDGSQNAASSRMNQDLTFQALSQVHPAPDLAIWSESSVTNVWVDPQNRFNPPNNALQPFFQAAGIPVLFGGIVVKDYDKRLYMNAAILASPAGDVIDTYGKMHPVPFAESIPFFEYPAVQSFFRNVVGIWNPWWMGSRYTIFSVPLRAGGSLRFGVPICFEDAFSDLDRGFITRGADMLLNITNDSWSNTWSSEIQHFQVARFRAIENRRVLVRSTNGGVSGVIGPWGEVWGRMPFFTSAWHAVTVPVYKEKTFTPYTRFGDYFPRLVLAFLFIVLVVNVLRNNVLPKKRGYPGLADDPRSGIASLDP